MKAYFSILVIMITTLSVGLAQNNNFQEKSDPNAKLILDKLEKQFKSYTSYELPFTIEFENPETGKTQDKGQYIQKGKSYFIKLGSQEIYTDGKTNWVYLKDRNEVQITDVEPNTNNNFFSPQQLLESYKSNQFYYAITKESTIKGKKICEIEFKPLARGVSYTKIRLTIDKTQNKLISLRVFNRDGSKQTLQLGNVVSNKIYDASVFHFDPKTVPGIRIEDLRID